MSITQKVLPMMEGMVPKSFLDSASLWFKKTLSKDLNRSGLRYEDLMNNEQRDSAEALDLADRDYILGRMRRLKRASDLSFKGKEFTDYAPTPAFEYVWKQEMRLDMYKIAKKNDEFQALNAYRK